jgi:hypothetical protein
MFGINFLRKPAPQPRYRDGQFAPSEKRLSIEAKRRKVKAELIDFVAQEKLERVRRELIDLQLFGAVEDALNEARDEVEAVKS